MERIIRSKFLPFLICCLISNFSNGQQISKFVGGDVSKIITFYNPGYTGVKANINVVGQTVVNSHDYSSNFIVDSRLPLFKKNDNINFSLGIKYRSEYQTYAEYETYGLSLSNAFRLKNGHKLSFGVGYDKVESNPKSYCETCPSLLRNTYYYYSQYERYGLGLYFESAEKKLFGGISYDMIQDSDNYESANPQNSQPVEIHNLFGSAGGVIDLGSKMSFIPSTAVKTDLKTTDVQVLVKAYYKDWFYIGPIWEVQNYIGVISGGRFGWEKVGYFDVGGSYHLNPSKLSSSSPSYSMYLNYFFLSKNNKESINYN